MKQASVSDIQVGGPVSRYRYKFAAAPGDSSFSMKPDIIYNTAYNDNHYNHALRFLSTSDLPDLNDMAKRDFEANIKSNSDL